MLVDIKLKLPWTTKESHGQLELSPVAAITDFPLEDQLEMWLLRSGLIQIESMPLDDYQFLHNFQFLKDNSDLLTLDGLKNGDTVEVRPKELLKQEVQTPTTKLLEQLAPLGTYSSESAFKTDKNVTFKERSKEAFSVSTLMKQNLSFNSSSSSSSSSSTSFKQSSIEEEKPNRKRDQKAAQKQKVFKKPNIAQQDQKKQPKVVELNKPQSKVVDHKRHQEDAKNKNYFKCPEVDSSLIAIKSEKFSDIASLQKKVDSWNKIFGDECIRIPASQGKYVKVDCKYKACVYQHWFNFQEKNGKKYQIEYFRSINQSHCKDSHEAAEIKDTKNCKF